MSNLPSPGWPVAPKKESLSNSKVILNFISDNITDELNSNMISEDLVQESKAGSTPMLESKSSSSKHEKSKNKVRLATYLRNSVSFNDSVSFNELGTPNIQ